MNIEPRIVKYNSDFVCRIRIVFLKLYPDPYQGLGLDLDTCYSYRLDPEPCLRQDLDPVKNWIPGPKLF